MTRINFNAIDLNLLRVFDALFVERSATRAGERLNLSQSTISHSLARLRHLLNDDLFIRSANGMVPTDFALEIGPVVHQVLSRLRTALTEPKFDPGKSDRVFSIACGDYTVAVLLPKVLAILWEVAPNIRIRLLPLHPSNTDDMEDGRLDLIVSDFGAVAEKFRTEPLIQDRIVCVMRHGNPHARPPLTREQLFELPLVIPSYGIREEDDCHGEALTNWRGLEIRGGWHLGLLSDDDAPEGSAASAPKRITLVNLLAAVDVVRATDFVAVLPARIVADKAPLFGLQICELPPSSRSARIDLQMLSHRMHGAQPAVAWLRQIFRQAAAQLDSVSHAARVAAGPS